MKNGIDGNAYRSATFHLKQPLAYSTETKMTFPMSEYDLGFLIGDAILLQDKVNQDVILIPYANIRSVMLNSKESKAN